MIKIINLVPRQESPTEEPSPVYNRRIKVTVKSFLFIFSGQYLCMQEKVNRLVLKKNNTKLGKQKMIQKANSVLQQASENKKRVPVFSH